jgi:hypothetical protein
MARAKTEPAEEVVVPVAAAGSGVAESVAPPMAEYRANWRLDGLPSGPLEPGQVVTMDQDAAALFVAGGVLSRVDG